MWGEEVGGNNLRLSSDQNSARLSEAKLDKKNAMAATAAVYLAPVTRDFLQSLVVSFFQHPDALGSRVWP